MLADLLPAFTGALPAEAATGRRALCEELTELLGGYRNEGLEKLIMSGIAYHHAGLTSQERSVVEKGFRCGQLLVLTATSTLAAGVNLPASRVILRSLWQGVGPVSRSQYLQMIGRAGRAGHSTVGEAFIMGKGNSYSNMGDWNNICSLLVAPMPCLRSCLLQKPAAAAAAAAQAGGSGAACSGAGSGFSTAAAVAAANESNAVGPVTAAIAAAAAATAKPSGSYQDDDSYQSHLQKLLLDSIAASHASCGKSIEHLIKCTFAYHQVEYQRLHQGTKSALAQLRAQGMITLRPAANGQPARWEVTDMGRAVYDSSLPTKIGVMMYQVMQRANQKLVLGNSLHLIYLLLLDHPFEIFNWPDWHSLFSSLPRAKQAVAVEVGVSHDYVNRMMSGGRANEEQSRAHSKFAAACALDMIICEGHLSLVEELWGRPAGLTRQGVSRGQLQKLQGDLAKWAGMAAMLCQSAGWWQLEALLGSLSQQAAAGVRPELLKLMQVPSLSPAQARALYDAGICTPQHLAVALEEDVKAAVAKALPRNNKASKLLEKRGLSVGVTGNSATNAVVARAARQLMASAQEWVLSAAELHQAAAQELDVMATQVDMGGNSGSSDAGRTGRSEPRPQAVLLTELQTQRAAAAGRPVPLPLGLGSSSVALRGQVQVLELSGATDPAVLQQALSSWLQQPAFAWALVTSASKQQQSETSPIPGLGSDPVLLLDGNIPAPQQAQQKQQLLHQHQQQIQGLAVCHSTRQVLYINLSSIGIGSSQAENPNLQRIQQAIRQAFSNPQAIATTFDLQPALVMLLRTGLDPCCGLQDALVAYQHWHPLQTGAGAEEVSARAMVQAVMPAYRLRIPVKHKSQVHEACRTALACHVASQPLKALLAQEGLAAQVASLAQPAVQLLGRAAMQAVAVQHSSLQANMQLIAGMLAAHQRHYDQQGLQPADISSAQGCSALADSISSKKYQSNNSAPDLFRLEGRLRKMVLYHELLAGRTNPATSAMARMLLAAVQLQKQQQLLNRLHSFCSADTSSSTGSSKTSSTRLQLPCSMSGPLGLLQNTTPSGLAGLLSYACTSSVPCLLSATSLQQELQQELVRHHQLQLPLPVAACLHPAADAAAAGQPGVQMQQVLLVHVSDGEPKRVLDFTCSGSQQHQYGATIRVWNPILDELQELQVPASSVWRLADGAGAGTRPVGATAVGATPARLCGSTGLCGGDGRLVEAHLQRPPPAYSYSSHLATTLPPPAPAYSHACWHDPAYHPHQQQHQQQHQQHHDPHQQQQLHQQHLQHPNQQPSWHPGSAPGVLTDAGHHLNYYGPGASTTAAGYTCNSSGTAAGPGSYSVVALAPYEPPSKKARLTGSSQMASLAEVAVAAATAADADISSAPARRHTHPQQHTASQCWHQQQHPATTFAPVFQTHTLRQHLVPQQPGHQFTGCQFQHLELSLLASATQDPLLLQALQQADPLAAIAEAMQKHSCFQKVLQHGGTAADQQQHGAACTASLQLLGLPCSGSEVVQLLLRSMAQGHGPKRLSEALHVERSAAMALQQALLAELPGIGQLKEQLLKQCMEGGYISTLLGRKLALKVAAKLTPKVRADAQRCALSMYMAASSAEVVRAAAVLAQAALDKQQEQQSIGSTAQLVLVTSHELVWQVPAGAAQWVLQVVGRSVTRDVAAQMRLAAPLKAWLWRGGSLDLLAAHRHVAGQQEEGY